MAADITPIRRRRMRTSVLPSVSPSTRTEPFDGCSYIEAIRTMVVLPEPLAPRISQCSSGCTDQHTSSRIGRSSRMNETWSSCRVGRRAGSDIGPPRYQPRATTDRIRRVATGNLGNVMTKHRGIVLVFVMLVGLFPQASALVARADDGTGTAEDAAREIAAAR